MSLPPTMIERAFEIARSGRVASVQALFRTLEREGFSGMGQQLQGPTLRRQLRELCRDASRRRLSGES